MVTKIGAYEQSSLVLVKVLSPLHIGIGRVVGVVDLPVARDGLRLPVIPASSLKGALRGCFDEKIAKIIFGPEPRSEETEHYAGAFAVLDGYILTMPARSLKGVYTLVTSRLLLKRFEQLAEIVGIEQPLDQDLYDKAGQLGEKQILVSPTGRDKMSFGATPLILLNEEFELESVEYQELEKLAVKLGLEESWRLTIIHDDLVHAVIERSILRRERIRIRRETKTVETGALWSEEELPIGTLFVTAFLYSKARVPEQVVKEEGFEKPFSPEEIKKLVEDELFTKRKGYVIFGGHETIGRGLVQVKPFS